MPADLPVSTALQAVPESFFREAESVVRCIVSTASTTSEFCFSIDGLVIRCRFHDLALVEKIRPAFEHLTLTTPLSSADLTVHLWTEHPGLPSVPPAHPLMMETARKHLLRLCSDARFKAFDEDWLGSRTWIDLDASEAFYCVRNCATLPYYETAAPLRALLNAFLNRHRRQLVHASAVGDSRGGLLLVGEGGSGKSSTALLCLDSPLFHLADDWCVIAPGSSPRIASAYNSAKLRPDNLHRFPALAARIHNHDKLDEEKATLFLHRHFPEKLLSACPARALLLPTVTGEKTTRVERVAGTHAWRAMVSCTLAQIPGADRDSIALMSAFSARLPAYRLLLGRDLPAIPGVLSGLLDQLTA
ncbi:MAG: hypothetical protein H7Y06_08035 [Opitutaceae bacterium]|nr:hypothetical protein [Opitutaceae bacterium]